MKATNSTKSMKELLNKESPLLPKLGDIIKGKIIKISNTELVLELGPLGTGVIYGAELKENKHMIKDLDTGDEISALVIDPENDEGYVELSFKQASIKQTWADLKEKKKANEAIEVRAIEANRGGLVVRVDSIVGFLPASHLSPENYPHVESGDKSEIAKELNKLVGKEFKVKIISLDQKNDKFIVSEKAVQEKKIEKKLEKYQKGDIIEGTVSGITDFGAFVRFADDLEGLIHISELDWDIVEHPSSVLKEKQEIKAQILDIQKGQVSLSLRTLKKDPWEDIKDKYQNGQKIMGKVIKLTSAGAFVEIEKGVIGLIHSSLFKNTDLAPGQSCEFKITSFAPNMHKMALQISSE